MTWARSVANRALRLAVVAAVVLAIGGCMARSPARASSSVLPTRSAVPGPSGQSPGATVAAMPTANFPTFTPATFSGTRDTVIPLPVTHRAASLLAADFGGPGAFVVTALAADGTQLDLLVDSIGAYSGISLLGLRDRPTAIRVQANGHWTIDIRPIASGRPWAGSEPIKGNGDDVLVLSAPPSSALRSRVAYSGTETLAITAVLAGSTSLLVDEMGSYSGDLEIPAGTELLQVHADGPWNLTAR